MQTCIKSRSGLGHPIVIYFWAPTPKLNKPGDTVETIRYDFRAKGQDIDLIRAKDWYAYCHKQCLKMCYYVQKMHSVEILKMRAEFARDDNGTVWFLYANQIFRRELKTYK